MCERKPGPRCSADTTKLLERLKSSSDRLEQKMFMAGANSRDKSVESSEHYALRLEWENVQFALDEAVLQFNATPSGLDALKQKLGWASGKQLVDRVGAFDPASGAWVEGSVVYPEGMEIGVNLKAAEAHRSWQNQMVKQLQSVENVSAASALFCAQNFRQNLEKKLEAVEGDLSDYNRYEQAVLDYCRNSTPDRNQQVIDAIHARVKKEKLLAYARLKVADLVSYENELQRKLAA